ncbi:hypothetical protein PoB_007213200 [Plakobranchus ocellatus]|uniref:Uncharacterized protein n=1 Tax=Plakobranchus ocellatus TaxID=259542 RepID=A0AAV4DMX1_9GAST|nr:hypothetical protein PoB_007213200 [Plakobranchus ocellatus]
MHYHRILHRVCTANSLSSRHTLHNWLRAFIVQSFSTFQKEERSQKAQENFKSALSKIRVHQNAVTPALAIAKDIQEEGRAQNKMSGEKEGDATRAQSSSSLFTSVMANHEAKISKYKLIEKHINIIAVAVFGFIWLGITLGFFIAILT